SRAPTWWSPSTRWPDWGWRRSRADGTCRCSSGRSTPRSRSATGCDRAGRGWSRPTSPAWRSRCAPASAGDALGEVVGQLRDRRPVVLVALEAGVAVDQRLQRVVGEVGVVQHLGDAVDLVVAGGGRNGHTVGVARVLERLGDVVGGRT